MFSANQQIAGFFNHTYFQSKSMKYTVFFFLDVDTNNSHKLKVDKNYKFAKII